MAAGPAAHRSDALCVDAETVSISSQKSNRGFDILHRRRELMPGREAIADSSCDVSTFRKPDRDRQVTLPRPGAKSTAMNENYGGPFAGCCIARMDDIHRNALTHVRIFNVRYVNDSIRNCGRRLGENCPRTAKERGKETELHGIGLNLS